jgi:hypothetical protein
MRVRGERVSSELVAFLRARLDEDAELAATGETWSAFDEMHGTRRVDVDHSFERVVACTRSWRGVHIARHDPARVLREVEAKRAVVQLHHIVHRNVAWLEDGQEAVAELPVCGHCVPRHSAFPSRQDVPEGPCATVLLLAAVYADHPDYRQEWTP